MTKCYGNNECDPFIHDHRSIQCHPLEVLCYVGDVDPKGQSFYSRSVRASSDFEMSVLSFLIPHCFIPHTPNTWTSWHGANSDQMNELKVANLLIQYLEGTISKGQAIKCQEDHQKEVMLGRTLKGRNMPSGREKRHLSTYQNNL